MASAVVTLKLTPDELRTIGYALDETARTLDETLTSMSPHDGRALRQMLAKVKELRPKL